MATTVSVAQLAHGRASRAIQDAQREPVLVSKENRPAAWIVGVDELARVAAARGMEADVYQRALELIAVDLYEREIVTLAQAAKLSGFQLDVFIDLCSRLRIPILWEPEAGITEVVAGIVALLEDRAMGG